MSTSDVDKMTRELVPTEFLKEGSGHADSTALIILNSPISDRDLFLRLYNHASFRLAADGGANRIYDILTEHYPGKHWSEAVSVALPDIIHGDLDSIADDVRDKYESIGIEITRDTDVYSTDFGKAIKVITKRLPHVKTTLILGSLGGRVDQGVGLLHELYREQKYQHPGLRFWLFTERSVTTLLSAGTTRIYTPLDEGLITRNVGILPLYGPASISTEGLEWDVTDWPTEMGGQVSTSNHIVKDWIKIATDREVVFTVERAKKK